MIALIMAGGFGTRFWPLSRKNLPKQYLRLFDGKSMLQRTAERLLQKVSPAEIYIVTAEAQIPLIREHLPMLPEKNIIVEPFGMNTAPCIGLSLAYLRSRISAEEDILVLPSDHIIQNTEAFLESIEQAQAPAAEGYLVTFGIIPDYPATGYGYIEAGEIRNNGSFTVRRFKEKPDRETAKKFLNQGGFYWNSGMFYWKMKTIWSAYEAYLPMVADLLEQIMLRWRHQGQKANIVDYYIQMPKIPVDIGIMERSDRRVVIPVDYGWSDVGSWKTLSELTPKNGEGNSVPIGYCLDAKNNYVHSDKYVSLIGVENLCVIETDDALLIVNKEQSEDVKKVVDKLSERGSENLL